MSGAGDGVEGRPLDGAPDLMRFDQLVFSGGGTRCFWHGGFVEVVGPAIRLAPARIAAVSGGALSASAFVGDVETRLRRVMGEALGERARNLSVDWNEARANGLTPHQEMYREIVDETLTDEAIARIADGPAFQVLLAHPPIDAAPRLSTMPLMAVYELDKAVRSSPHVVSADALGADRVLVDARQAARDGDLVDLVCLAAVIPPVFDVTGWKGRPVVDGGMANKAPMPDPDEGTTLILLTSKYRELPSHPGRLYVEPGESVPADKIDFTDRDKIEATWEAGREDGRAFLERHGIA